MPVDQTGILDMVFDADAKRFTDFGSYSKTSVWLLDAEYRSGFAVDIDCPAFEAQYCGRLTCCLGPCERRGADGEGETDKAAARKHVDLPAGRRQYVDIM
jgi:hypothetical protein